MPLNNSNHNLIPLKDENNNTIGLQNGMDQVINDRKKTNNLLKKVLKHKLFPGIFQVPVAIVFAFIIWELSFGTADPHDNFGTAMTWVLWWPLIPLLFIVFGRFWCGVCPFATLSDLVQKFVGLNRPVPKFLKRYDC